VSVAAAILRFAGEREPFNVPFEEQIAFLRQKVALPTRTWRDLEGRAHDRAFVVAGVEKEAVLADLRQAIDDAVAKGERLEAFRKRFDGIVAQHGWIGGAGEENPAWRARVIYDTNVRTSYMAGRLKQMRDPDVVRLRPYWQYRHADLREPKTPRLQHKAWDRIVLRHDDPWWTKHYPPNGWGCTCGVRPLSRREMLREQEKRGLTDIDEAPADNPRRVKDPLTSETVKVPEGVALGWDHQPGDAWERGLVPPELQQPLEPSTTSPRKAAPVLPSITTIAKPLVTPIAPAGLPAEDYLDGFLLPFGARRGPGGGVLFRDVAGHAVPISEDLFRDTAGNLKIMKYGQGRERHLPRLGEALRDPDEVWVDWVADKRPGQPAGASRLVRNYLRFDPLGGALAVFAYAAGFGWAGSTIFPPKLDKRGETKPVALEEYLNDVRTGALLYRRP
jgi:hypothetical protein